MSLKVLINQEASYLLLKVQGEYSLEALESLFSQIREESIEKGYKNILVDISGVSGTMGDMDSFSLGKMASRTWGGLRVALVYRGAQINKFFEDVAFNRGVQTIVVQDINLALEWLTGSPPNKQNAGTSE